MQITSNKQPDILGPVLADTPDTGEIWNYG